MCQRWLPTVLTFALDKAFTKGPVRKLRSSAFTYSPSEPTRFRLIPEIRFRPMHDDDTPREPRMHVCPLFQKENDHHE